MLEDKELNTLVDLRVDSVYTFYHSPEMDPKRFELLFSPAQGISENVDFIPQMQVRQGEVLISGKSNEMFAATLFSIDGKLICTSGGSLFGGITMPTGNLQGGIYILQVVNSKYSSTKKILIR